MAKRFTDTNKYKKPFLRSLQGAYKLLWDFLYHECDHAGIWIVDFTIAQIYVGKDMKINYKDAIKNFNKDEVRIVELDNGNKWFIPSFISFQYGTLNEKNRAHLSVISILSKYNLLDEEKKIKPLTSPLQGDKDKDKDMDMVKDMDKGGETKIEEAPGLFDSEIPIPTKEDSEFTEFKQWIKDNASNVGKMNEPFTKEQMVKIKSKFDSIFIFTLLTQMHNYKPLREKNTSAYLTFLNWANNRDKK